MKNALQRPVYPIRLRCETLQGLGVVSQSTIYRVCLNNLDYVYIQSMRMTLETRFATNYLQFIELTLNIGVIGTLTRQFMCTGELAHQFTGKFTQTALPGARLPPQTFKSLLIT